MAKKIKTSVVGEDAITVEETDMGMEVQSLGSGYSQDKKLERAGAMWVRTSKSGNEYFSVDVNGAPYMALKNRFKDSEKKPDYIIYKREKQKQ